MESETKNIAPVMETPMPLASPSYITQTKENIRLLQGLVKDVLKREVDYGRIPGTPQDSLWEPGASKILSAFNCYSDPEILHFSDRDGITFLIKVRLISRLTNQIVGSGVGACSTDETKYKYRWVEKPEEWGIEGEEKESLKTRQVGNTTLYKIPNPEKNELIHTLFKMAVKRSEVDAAESLPGVASTLREMFTTGIKEGTKIKSEEEDWSKFWGEARRLGLDSEETHEILAVKSMKDWQAQGKTLPEALAVLQDAISKKTEAKKPESPKESPRSPVKAELEKMGAQKVETPVPAKAEEAWKAMGFFSLEEQKALRDEIYGNLIPIMTKEQMVEFAGKPSAQMTKQEMMQFLVKSQLAMELNSNLGISTQAIEKEKFLNLNAHREWADSLLLHHTGKKDISKLSQIQIEYLLQQLKEREIIDPEQLPF